MSEPIYEEDSVNLGYLNKRLKKVSEDISLPNNISRHYASKPQPPYYKGDTWIDGSIIYTCINSRDIGLYTDSDWVTESGAKEEAESKNKVFLSKPSNYKVGDMWILQSDDDHKAGKKGEVLIAIAGQRVYNEDNWINMLGYGTIRSINEVANNINDALERLKLTKADGVVTIFYNDRIPDNPITGDLWFVTDNIDDYVRENVYKYNGATWEQVKDSLSIIAFEEANEARLVSDGKIRSFYSETEPKDNMGVGDIWRNTILDKLYRYNGINWVAVYDPNLKELRRDVETITETTTSIMTDLGKIVQEVSVIEDKIVDLGYKDEVDALTEVYIQNAGKGYLIKLEIQGNKTYENHLYPGADLYLGVDLYPNMQR